MGVVINDILYVHLLWRYEKTNALQLDLKIDKYYKF